MSTQVKTNAFIGQREQPTETELTKALGPSRQVWQQLLSELAEQVGVMTTEWKCYSVKMGWAVRVMRGKRTVLWLSPFQGCFGVTFIFGAKAMTALEKCKLPKRITRILSEAPKYPEGTGVLLQVKSAREISTLKKLAAIKVAS